MRYTKVAKKLEKNERLRCKDLKKKKKVIEKKQLLDNKYDCWKNKKGIL